MTGSSFDEVLVVSEVVGGAVEALVNILDALLRFLETGFLEA